MQVWLLQNAAVQSLVIAFRGTEQVKWKDMVTDLSFQPAPFNPERVFERSNSASLIRQEASASIPCMHAFCCHASSLACCFQDTGSCVCGQYF